jgi:hypothetical protein
MAAWIAASIAVVGLLVDYSLVVVDDVWLLPLEPVVSPTVLVVQLFSQLVVLAGS